MKLSARQLHCLRLMEIDVWASRHAVPLPSIDQSARDPGANPLLEALRTEVSVCTRCALHRGRTQTVFGVGNPAADWLLIGEAPGVEEDRQGEPFVGRAGQLLNAMLEAIGLKREQVYIANILKCLRYNALIQLGDGSWERVGRLVRSRYDGSVMSVDQTGQLVRRRVTGWHESPLGGRRVFRLTYRSAKNAGKSRVSIQLTGDHGVLTRRGFVQAAELKPDDEIATGQGLSPIAFDVICGTLLGDATLNPDSSYLGFSHAVAQREYALFKGELLKELNPRISEDFVAAVVGGQKRYEIVSVRTLAHRALRLLRKEFYQCGKHVPPWMSKRLNERMLAFWYMDDGHTRIRPNRQPIAEIATCGFSDQDLLILLEGLTRLGLRATARRGRLHFDVTATRELCRLIAPYVPPSMRYKLHPEFEARIPFDRERLHSKPAVVFYDNVEIQDVTSEQRSDTTFFCIDVEETHNFVTAGGVVHNCRPPKNRDPRPEEAQSCQPYLRRQIEFIQPKIILALGRIAAQNLLKVDTPIGRMRGRCYEFPDPPVPVVVTYHPAYLLRSPREKRKSWEDLQYAMGIYRGLR